MLHKNIQNHFSLLQRLRFLFLSLSFVVSFCRCFISILLLLSSPAGFLCATFTQRGWWSSRNGRPTTLPPLGGTEGKGHTGKTAPPRMPCSQTAPSSQADRAGLCGLLVIWDLTAGLSRALAEERRWTLPQGHCSAPATPAHTQNTHTQASFASLVMGVLIFVCVAKPMNTPPSLSLSPSREQAEVQYDNTVYTQKGKFQSQRNTFNFITKMNA